MSKRNSQIALIDPAPAPSGMGRGSHAGRAFNRSGTAPGLAVRAAADGSAEIDLYDEIGIWGVTASAFRRQLNGVDASSIVLRINSPGGDVFDGIAMFNDLLTHPARVRIEVTGLAASAASVIAMAGDEIHMAANAFMMIHNAWAVAIGDRDDMAGMAEVLGKIDAALAATYAQRTGIDAEEATRLMSAETWMTAADAQTRGFADTVDGEAADTQAMARFDLSLFAHTPAPLMAQAVTEPQQPDGEEGDEMNITDLTIDTLAAERPDLVAAITNAADAAARTEGAESERTRILGIEENCAGYGAHAELIARAKADGKTTPDQAAAAILAAERGRGKQLLDDMRGDDPEEAPVPSGSDAGNSDTNASKDPKAIAAAARELVDAEAQAGRTLSVSDAVHRVVGPRKAA